MAVWVIFLLSTAISLSEACKSWSKPKEIQPRFVCEESPDADLGDLTRRVAESEIFNIELFSFFFILILLFTI